MTPYYAANLIGKTQNIQCLWYSSQLAGKLLPHEAALWLLQKYELLQRDNAEIKLYAKTKERMVRTVTRHRRRKTLAERRWVLLLMFLLSSPIEGHI